MSEKSKYDKENNIKQTDVDLIPMIDLEPFVITPENLEKKTGKKQSAGKNSVKTSNENHTGKKTSAGKNSDKKSKRKNKLPLAVYMCGFMMYMELVFHLVKFGMSGENMLLKLIFGAFFGAIFALIISLFGKKVQMVLSFLFTIIVTLYFGAQIIYSGVFSTYLSISGTFNVADQALDFTDVIANEIFGQWWKLILILIPLIYLSFRGRKIIDFKGIYRRKKISDRLKILAAEAFAVIFFFAAANICMGRGKNDMYSAYNMYRHYSSIDMSTAKLGVSETFVKDVAAGLAAANGKTEEVSFETAEDVAGTEDTVAPTAADTAGEVLDFGENLMLSAKGIDTSPNVMDIDFDSLIAQETNQNIINLHEYISEQTPTNKNEYTGMFEGYNLIFVVAEGFSGYVVDEQRTPTLYKMIHEGFYFKNYYTPLWYGSTLGGEYADLTGLMPQNGGYLSMEKAGESGNDMYFTLGKQLSRLGYKTTAYHANDYTYYDRNVSHPNMGYDWIAVGTGYEPEYSSDGTALWPQSDLRLVENTFADYADDQPFHTYYLTVSGHVMYNWTGNAMSARHKDLVEDLDYSDTTKAYIACQYELELAMEELLADLEDAGIADNTLIVLTADHVPYNDKDVVDELAGYELDSEFEWYKNALIIYSPSMNESVEVDKYCSSLDILPTVSNLMGLEYDSRMLVGQDILSDAEGLIMFNDRSFITDRCSYNASTGEVKSLDGSQISDEYVSNMKKIVSNKFNMAQSICDNDYYRYIDPYLDEED